MSSPFWSRLSGPKFQFTLGVREDFFGILSICRSLSNPCLHYAITIRERNAVQALVVSQDAKLWIDWPLTFLQCITVMSLLSLLLEYTFLFCVRK